MSTRVEGRPARPMDRVEDPSVWGLSCSELHRAFWVSCGVACVGLGCGEFPEQGADVFLLVERGHAVYFDLRCIAEQLLWSGANLTRVRVAHEDAGQYSEQVVLDGAGDIVKIERRYARDLRSVPHFYLTADPRIALQWSRSDSPPAALAAMRRAVRLRLDAVDVEGARFDLAERGKREAFLGRLVREWPHPDRVIEGIARAADGVFAESGVDLGKIPRLVAPLWIGRVGDAGPPQAVIGPAVVADRDAGAPARVRSIDEIFFVTADGVSSGPSKPRALYPPVKRLADLLIAAVALVVFAPVMLGCAAAVCADDGTPVLFGHRRQAHGGRSFRCWKFRTMRRDSEAMVAQLRQRNVCDGPQVLIRDDPRVTRIGRWLRRLQLDELPQFWNVLVGDMSIVGPRPSPDNENQFCPAWREKRLSVRPGITGLWQVMRTRRTGVDFQEWIRYDMEYVDRMGPILDLKICVLTVVNALLRRGRGE